MTTSRLDLVDALRGFALVSIMLLHNIEHFDLYFAPPGQPAWLQALDGGVWSTMFAVFGGKSYAIFALLFGVTFQLQHDGRAACGEDFRARFAWRMLLLLGFGLVNSAFYQGDILSLYALLGLCLVPVARLRARTVLCIAGLLALQPFAWVAVAGALGQAPAKLPDPASWALFERANAYLMHGGMLDAWIGNLTNGKRAVLLWSWEMGRLLQIPALFMLGMVAARAGLFVVGDASQRAWRRILLAALLLLAPLWFAHAHLDRWIAVEAVRRPLAAITGPWTNLAAMLALASGFALLYRRRPHARLFGLLRPLGRMSLSCYMMQSLAGALLYHGYGLALYRHTGATQALLLGLALVALQGWFCAWWLRRHRQGPLEALWHRLTWIGGAHRPRRAA